MQSCKSQYDYEQLVTNYIEANTVQKYKEGEVLINGRYKETAQGRLSFDGPYLVSYNTKVAKFVHTKKATYILIDEYKYSTTTSKQLRILRDNLPNNVHKINTSDIDNSFNAIKDYYFARITDTYKYCEKARVSKPLQAAIETYKSIIRSILPELHYKTREATLRKLNGLPNIPDKLDKFTRPILLSVLKNKGLLDVK